MDGEAGLQRAETGRGNLSRLALSPSPLLFIFVVGMWQKAA